MHRPQKHFSDPTQPQQSIKWKLSVYISIPKKTIWALAWSENSPIGPNKAKNYQNWKLKNYQNQKIKKSENKNLISYQYIWVNLKNILATIAALYVIMSVCLSQTSFIRTTTTNNNNKNHQKQQQQQQQHDNQHHDDDHHHQQQQQQ